VCDGGQHDFCAPGKQFSGGDDLITDSMTQRGQQ
jgi:hypothetical protein